MVPEIWPGQNLGEKEEKKRKNNEANWMVSNSAQLDRRTKQHTQFGVSASNGSRDMGRTKSWREKKKNERRQSHIASPTGMANNCQVNTVETVMQEPYLMVCEQWTVDQQKYPNGRQKMVPQDTYDV